jgi:cold shock CspA family protein
MLENEQRGKVTRVIYDKGYGFIESEDGKTYFFHAYGTRDFDRLMMNDRVVFYIQEHEKGLRAIRVRRAP